MSNILTPLAIWLLAALSGGALAYAAKHTNPQVFLAGIALLFAAWLADTFLP